MRCHLFKLTLDSDVSNPSNDFELHRAEQLHIDGAKSRGKLAGKASTKKSMAKSNLRAQSDKMEASKSVT
jgi:hypothetical protein